MDSTKPPATGDANVRHTVPLLWVGDIAHSIRFYRDGLGFAVKHQWEPAGRLQWCWLERGGAAIMLQEAPHDRRDRVRAPEAHAAMDLYFICEDAVALWKQFVARGLAPGRPQVGNGMWVTRLEDPDGRAVFFESPTDTPEDTVFTG